MERTKACTHCGEEKPITEFSKHRHSPDGYAYQCKKCNAKRAKEWRSTPSGIYTNITGRSNHYKKTGTKVYKPVKISRKDFINWYNSQPKKCVYCDILEEDVMLLSEHYRMNRERLSVDCVENLNGYYEENMVLACGRCNFIKGDVFDFDEMRALAQGHIKPKWIQLKKEKGEKDDI